MESPPAQIEIQFGYELGFVFRLLFDEKLAGVARPARRDPHW